MPTDDMPTRLADSDAGCWSVRTHTAVYLLDLDQRTSTRVLDVPVTGDGDVAVLRRDTDPVPLIELLNCLVGAPLEQLLDVRGDAVTTYRRSTRVTAITAVSGSGGVPGPRGPAS